MITALSVEVLNVRALGDVRVDPLTDGGVTALNGLNGSGKSSILSAILWAMYGVTPDGVPMAAMRRQGSTGDCKAVFTFAHQDQVVAVERGLKGARDASYAKVTVDGREQSFGKVKAAEAWMVNRLGLDAEGFMTAFVIQQKQLDALVRARPAERRRLIERLAGIDRMSLAVKSARVEETETKHRLDMLPGSASDLAGAEVALQMAQTAAAGSWEATESTRVAADAAGAALTKVTNERDQMQEGVAEHNRLQQVAVAASHQATLMMERESWTATEVNRLRTASVGGTTGEVVAARTALETATTVERQNQDARAAVGRANAQLAADQERASAASVRLEQARKQQVTTKTAAGLARIALGAYPEDMGAQVDIADAEANTLLNAVGALRGEHARLELAIKSLAASTSPECPTCASGLTDPAALLSSLRATQVRVLSEGQAVSAQQKVAAERVRVLRVQVSEQRDVQQSVQHTEGNATLAQQAVTEAEKILAPLSAVALTSQTEADAARVAAAAAVNTQAEVAETVERARGALRVAENAAEAAEHVPAAEAAALAAATAATAAQSLATEADRVAQAAAVSVSALTQISEAFEAALVLARTTDSAASASAGEARLLHERAGVAERTRDIESAKVLARGQTAQELELKAAVRDALDEFRKDRIAVLAPELSEIATEFVQRMTDGKFVAVELDEEFTPVVTDAEGLQRPVAWLSGGEESAVALALRVAIGEVIAGQRGGMLWMDEPFTAQDAQRRPAMMSALRDLPGRQIVVINHASEATDMVDRVIEIVADSENGSYALIANEIGMVSEAVIDSNEQAAI